MAEGDERHVEASTLTSAVLLRQENSAICPSKEIKTTSFRSLPQSSLRSSCHGYVTTNVEVSLRGIDVVVVAAGGVGQGKRHRGTVSRRRLKRSEMLSLVATVVRNCSAQLRDFYTDNAQLYI